jgi:predicted esterase
MQHHRVKVQKTAHYYTHGEPSQETQYFWFVTHGYGQLASNIIRKFEHLDPTHHFVVAPEALSRFYWKMQEPTISASWMTKMDRLDEIEDFTQYLKNLFDSSRALIPQNTKIILFGFSQGAATQLRWITNADPSPPFDEIILWGGPLPEDIDYTKNAHIFDGKQIQIVVGDKDEFISEDSITKHIQFANDQNLQVKLTTFEGKHEILVPVLNNLIEKLFVKHF